MKFQPYAKKFYSLYISLVAKFLNIVVKSFLICLESMMES